MRHVKRITATALAALAVLGACAREQVTVVMQPTATSEAAHAYETRLETNFPTSAEIITEVRRQQLNNEVQALSAPTNNWYAAAVGYPQREGICITGNLWLSTDSANLRQAIEERPSEPADMDISVVRYIACAQA